MELLKLLSANEIVAQLLCFLFLFFFLRTFLWGRFLKILDDRRERIASEFKKIEDLKAEMAKAKAEYENQLNTIQETARQKIQEAIIQGKEIAKEIEEKAHKSAEKIIDDAKANLEQDLAKAKKELKNHIVDLTLAATEKVIEEKLTKEQDRKLVANFVDDLEETI